MLIQFELLLRCCNNSIFGINYRALIPFDNRSRYIFTIGLSADFDRFCCKKWLL